MTFAVDKVEIAFEYNIRDRPVIHPNIDLFGFSVNSIRAIILIDFVIAREKAQFSITVIIAKRYFEAVRGLDIPADLFICAERFSYITVDVPLCIERS